MPQSIVIRFQKVTGEPEKDDVVHIARSEDNPMLFSITSKPYNGSNSKYSGIFSLNDMHTYLDHMFNVALNDMSEDDAINMIQYDIPGFPSVVAPSEAYWDDDVYDAFTGAVNFWATTM